MIRHCFWEYFPTVFALLLLFNAASFADTIAEKLFEAAPGGTLIIESDQGAINVEISAQQRVHVKVVAEKSGWRGYDTDAAKRLTVDFQKGGNDIKVKAWLKKKHNGKINGGGPDLYLHTSSGKVKIRRM